MTKHDEQTFIDQIASRSVTPSQVRPDGQLTDPRTYGVYEVDGAGRTRRFRFGNHPVRMQELEREFGACTLRYLFYKREDAKAMATARNSSGHGA